MGREATPPILVQERPGDELKETGSWDNQSVADLHEELLRLRKEKRAHEDRERELEAALSALQSKVCTPEIGDEGKEEVAAGMTGEGGMRQQLDVPSFAFVDSIGQTRTISAELKRFIVEAHLTNSVRLAQDVSIPRDSSFEYSSCSSLIGLIIVTHSF